MFFLSFFLLWILKCNFQRLHPQSFSRPVSLLTENNIPCTYIYLESCLLCHILFFYRWFPWSVRFSHWHSLRGNRLFFFSISFLEIVLFMYTYVESCTLLDANSHKIAPRWNHLLVRCFGLLLGHGVEVTALHNLRDAADGGPCAQYACPWVVYREDQWRVKSVLWFKTTVMLYSGQHFQKREKW